jgi:hypothetical protein
MLIYANSFVLEPAGGTEQVIQFIAKWVGTRARSYVDAGRLAEGIKELRLKDESTLSSRATVDEGQALYPYFFAARLSHRDDKVSGRRWITEVGVRQEAPGALVKCSILLKTDEVSAQVTSPIQVTRPKLVSQLIEHCHPVGETPGLTVKCLNEEGAQAFFREIERHERQHPIVLISCNRDGAYPVELRRLAEVLVGLAYVVDVPIGVDTFSIEKVVGRQFISFGGAIRIIFPMRRGDRGSFCETILFKPDDIHIWREDDKAVESQILAAITHRTNLPYSWQHTSLEMVSQAMLRFQLTRMIERSKGSDHAAELVEYTLLLAEADKELGEKDKEVERLRSDYEEKSNDARKLQADIESLKHALNGRQAADDSYDNEAVAVLAPLREAVSAVLKGNPKLQQTLDLIAALFGDRIVVLNSAFDSAKESDRSGFDLGDKAYDLLSKLATEYWQALAEGKSDQQAKGIFGQNAYSANEASAMSNAGKNRRTFSYRNREFLMERHLKHGVKDSKAETLRIHFEWLAEEKKIVVGHCGKHLDF